MKSEEILIAPVVTEKSNLMREQKGVYTFKVSQRANKAMVMLAVRELFSVSPLACRVVNVSPKKKRIMNKSARGRKGMTSSWKKAYVSLREGESLNLFSE